VPGLVPAAHSASISGGVKKLMNGVPAAREPLGRLRPGRPPPARRASGSMNVAASVEPAATPRRGAASPPSRPC
jgi:hypothetical protein